MHNIPLSIKSYVSRLLFNKSTQTRTIKPRKLDEKRDMKVGIITCWYKDLSMADYADNLRRSLDNRLDFQIITAPCVCWRRFVGKRNAFQGNCSHSSFPPYIATLESNVAPAILKPLVFFVLLCLQFLRGVDYLSKCKRCNVIHYL
jgi:hypothetical protein